MWLCLVPRCPHPGHKTTGSVTSVRVESRGHEMAVQWLLFPSEISQTLSLSFVGFREKAGSEIPVLQEHHEPSSFIACMHRPDCEGQATLMQGGGNKQATACISDTNQFVSHSSKVFSRSWETHPNPKEEKTQCTCPVPNLQILEPGLSPVCQTCGYKRLVDENTIEVATQDIIASFNSLHVSKDTRTLFPPQDGRLASRTCRQEVCAPCCFDDTTVDDLAGYFDQIMFLPKPMSEMAELMYT